MKEAKRKEDPVRRSTRLVGIPKASKRYAWCLFLFLFRMEDSFCIFSGHKTLVWRNKIEWMRRIFWFCVLCVSQLLTERIYNAHFVPFSCNENAGSRLLSSFMNGADDGLPARRWEELKARRLKELSDLQVPNTTTSPFRLPVAAHNKWYMQYSIPLVGMRKATSQDAIVTTRIIRTIWCIMAIFIGLIDFCLKMTDL